MTISKTEYHIILHYGVHTFNELLRVNCTILHSCLQQKALWSTLIYLPKECSCKMTFQDIRLNKTIQIEVIGFHDPNYVQHILHSHKARAWSSSSPSWFSMLKKPKKTCHTHRKEIPFYLKRKSEWRKKIKKRKGDTFEIKIQCKPMYAQDISY